MGGSWGPFSQQDGSKIDVENEAEKRIDFGAISRLFERGRGVKKGRFALDSRSFSRIGLVACKQLFWRILGQFSPPFWDLLAQKAQQERQRKKERKNNENHAKYILNNRSADGIGVDLWGGRGGNLLHLLDLTCRTYKT